MRLIDWDKVLEWMHRQKETMEQWSMRIAIENYVDEMSTVDAVPVIRCKDCKYYKDGDCWHEWNNDERIYYQSIINEPNPDDYCSRAERKEE